MLEGWQSVGFSLSCLIDAGEYEYPAHPSLLDMDMTQEIFHVKAWISHMVFQPILPAFSYVDKNLIHGPGPLDCLPSGKFSQIRGVGVHPLVPLCWGGGELLLPDRSTRNKPWQISHLCSCCCCGGGCCCFLKRLVLFGKKTLTIIIIVIIIILLCFRVPIFHNIIDTAMSRMMCNQSSFPNLRVQVRSVVARPLPCNTYRQPGKSPQRRCSNSGAPNTSQGRGN